ncbi:MAG TPA: hypothetical protein PK725_04575 [Rhodocyclaceae bacterium]|nr:hypothetical protein [Rhodocyclaceae bacterium]
MSKLFKLREWLTIPETARYMSISFGEDVTEADVLRLALDGHVRLSVHFVNHAKARCGKVISRDETDWWLCPDSEVFPGGRPMNRADQATVATTKPAPPKLAALLDELPPNEREKFVPIMRSLNIDDERFLTLSDDVVTLQGIWDLPMIGAERLDVEHQFQALTGGPAVTLINLEGAFVEELDGALCQLQEDFDENEYQAGSRAQLEVLKQRIVENGIEDEEAHLLSSRHKEERGKFLERRRTPPAKENCYPAGGLPRDAVFVVRTEALREFERSVDPASDVPEKPMTTTERNSLLTIIAALCEHSAINVQERGVAMKIAQLTEEMGAPVSDDTVRRALAKIPDALESRMA